MKIFKEKKEIVEELLGKKIEDTSVSIKWKQCLLGGNPNHCCFCIKREHSIFDIEYPLHALRSIHPNCQCRFGKVRRVKVGEATQSGKMGADYFLKNYGKLPSNYITKKQALKMEWDAKKGNLNEVAPGKIIGGDIFYNRNGKLPYAPDRIWYECDINYMGGFRGNQRLIFSNDGLIFMTDDHYTTYAEVA